MSKPLPKNYFAIRQIQLMRNQIAALKSDIEKSNTIYQVIRNAYAVSLAQIQDTSIKTYNTADARRLYIALHCKLCSPIYIEQEIKKYFHYKYIYNIQKNLHPIMLKNNNKYSSIYICVLQKLNKHE